MRHTNLFLMNRVSKKLDAERLLHGGYEYTEFKPEELRERRVPDFPYNVLNRTQQLYTPVVDRCYLEDGIEKPGWPGDADFAVCLTHDMDHVSKHSARQSFRNGMMRARTRWRGAPPDGYQDESGRLAAMKSVVGAFLDAGKDATKRGRDPFHRYEKWLEIEDEYDARSTFFVLPEKTEKPHVSDPEYRYGDRVVFDDETCTVAEMVAEIDLRGWEIGLHPSWYSYDDAGTLQEQKDALEDVVAGEVESVRQHYLHYDPRSTPRAHHDAGFSYDSTLGFNRNVGFRRGSSYPWRKHDIEDGDELDVLEVPLVVQDTAVFRDRGLGLGVEQALEYISLLAGKVRETGGVLTLSWHPSAVADARFEAYRRALEILDDMGAWFGSVQEVGERWMDNEVELRT